MFGRTSWQGRSYARAASGSNQQEQQQQQGQEADSRRSNQGVDFQEQARLTRDTNAFLRGDRLEKQAREKFLFQQRVKMEQKRSKLSRGNILNFLMDGKLVSDKRVLMNRVLRTAGFGPRDIDSIKLNEYRGAQAEVLLKEGVCFDVDEIDKKLRGEGLNVVVSSFDDKEEVLHIYGLALTTDIEGIKQKIKEAIEPFCEKVKDISATYHHKLDEEDFFGGVKDGNYKVKVVPSKDAQVHIPNFIVVDNVRKVCARAVYTKSVNDKKQMCLNCYSVDHFRNDIECPGPKAWEDYAEEFQTAWEEACVKKSNEYVDENPQVIEEVEEGRMARLISDINKKFSVAEEKISEQESEMNKLRDSLEAFRNEDEVTFKEQGLDNDEEDGPEDGEGEEGSDGSKNGLVDPLSGDWAEEMNEEENLENKKRTAVSPIEADRDRTSKIKKLENGQNAEISNLGLKVGQDYDICLGGNSDIPTATGKWKTGTLLSVKKGDIILDFKTGAKKINLRGFTNLIRPAPRKKSL